MGLYSDKYEKILQYCLVCDGFFFYWNNIEIICIAHKNLVGLNIDIFKHRRKQFSYNFILDVYENRNQEKAFEFEVNIFFQFPGWQEGKTYDFISKCMLPSKKYITPNIQDDIDDRELWRNKWPNLPSLLAQAALKKRNENNFFSVCSQMTLFSKTGLCTLHNFNQTFSFLIGFPL